MNTALLLINIQNDYFPNGRIALEKSTEIAAKAQTLLSSFREKKNLVIHVQHVSTNPNATSLLPCTKGAEFYPTVMPIKNEVIVKKHYANSFKDTQLLNALIKNQINHLVICGMTTDSSIDSTVRAAHDLGFTCTVVHDAIAARQLEFNNHVIPAQDVHLSFLAALYPEYANVVSTDDCLHRTAVRPTSYA